MVHERSALRSESYSSGGFNNHRIKRDFENCLSLSLSLGSISSSSSSSDRERERARESHSCAVFGKFPSRLLGKVSPDTDNDL